MEKNVKKTIISRWLFAGVASLALLLVSACEIGLGESVDVIPPTLKITYPEEQNQVIRDWFIVSGVCSDDRDVVKVTVNLENTDTGEVFPSLEADLILDEKVQKNTKWQIKLNEPDENGVFPYPDGKYVVTACAYDAKEKPSGDIGISLVIDNTAPLLVVTRPKSGVTDSGVSYTDAYGRNFSISGRAADDANMNLEIEVYGADAENKDKLLYIIPKNNIAPSIDINAAVFDEENAENPYNIIYGTTDKYAGTKNFYCKFRIYDSARRFTGSAEDKDSKGNSTEYYYQENNKQITAYLQKYTVTDMYHILNGLYKEETTRSIDMDVETVYSWLKEKTDTKEHSEFSLNPENSPTFAMMGGYTNVSTYTALKNSTVSNDENILIKVEAGRDGIDIVPETMGIYARKVVQKGTTEEWEFEKDSSGKELEPIILFKPYYKDAEGKNKYELTEEEIKAREEAYEMQGTTYTITAKVSDTMGLKISGTYLLEVVAYDQNGNGIYNGNKYYGFLLASKGVAPNLTLESPAAGTLYVKKGESIKLKGSAFHQEGTPNVIFTIKKSGSEVEKTIIISEEDLEKAEPKLSFDRDILPSEFLEDENESAQYDITIISTYSDKSTSPLERTVMYDVVVPEVTISTVTPQAAESYAEYTKGNTNFVNGKIRIIGSFNDEQTAINKDSIGYEYQDPEDSSKWIFKKLEKTQNFVIDFDTRTLAKDEEDLNIRFIAEDKAGNKLVAPLYYDEDTQKKYTVDQKTDKPKIEVSQIKVVGSFEDSTMGSFSKKTSVSGNLMDDDGIEKYKVTIYEINQAGEEIEYKTEEREIGGSITTQLPVELPAEDNTYKIHVQVWDMNEDEEKRSSEWSSFFKVTGDVPTVTLTEGNKAVKKSSDSVSLGGKVSGKQDAENPLKLYLTDEKNVDLKESKWLEVFAAPSEYREGTISWSATLDLSSEDVRQKIDVSEGEHTISLIVLDKSNLPIDIDFIYTIDDIAPVIRKNGENDTITIDGHDYKSYGWSSNTRFPIEACWTETGSGVEKINYWINKSSDSVSGDADGSYYDGLIIEDEFCLKKTITDFPDGENWLHLQAIDKAGNESLVSHFRVGVDTKKPVVTIDQTEIRSDGSKEIVITGSVSDSNKDGEIENGSGLNTWAALRVIKGDVPVYEEWAETDSQNKEDQINHPANEIAFVHALNGTEDENDNSVGAVPFNYDYVRTARFKVTLDPKDAAVSLDTDGEYELTFIALDQPENRGMSSVKIIVDSTAPEMEIKTVSNLIEANGKTNNVNGTVTLSGASTDADKVSETVITVYKVIPPADEDSEETLEEVTEENIVSTGGTHSVSNWTYVINTKNLDEDTEYVLSVKSTDRTGNENEISQRIYVDQDTDKPVVTPSNYFTDANTEIYNAETNEKGIHDGYNLFDQTGNSTLMASVEDDDKLSSIIAEYSANGISGWNKFFEKTGINSSTYSLKAPLVVSTEEHAASLSEGTYYVRFTVKDNGNVETTTVPFVIVVDVTPPTIMPYQLNGTSYSEGMYVKEDFTIVLNATNAEKVVSIYEIVDGVNSGDALANYSKSYTGEEDTHGANKTRTYRVTDKYGRTNLTSASYKVDKVPPVIDASKISVKGGAMETGVSVSAISGMWISCESVTVTGAAGALSDTNLASSVKAEVKTGAETASSTFEMSNLADGKFSATLAVPNGESEIKLTFTDTAGNTNIQTINVKVDNVAPSAESLSVTSTASGHTNAASVSAKFTPSDVTSGIAKAMIGKASGFADNEALATITSGLTNGTPKTQTVNISSLEEGSYDLWLRLVDNAGNRMQDKNIGHFVKDTTAPSVEFDAVADADADEPGTQVNKTIVISGTVTEANLPENAKPVLYIDDSITPSTNGTAGAVANGKWTIAAIDTTKLSDNTDHKFKVEFTDKAGNKTASANEIILNVSQDSDRPVVLLKNLNTDNSSILGDGHIAGTVSDDDGSVTKVEVKIEKLKEDDSGTYETVVNWTEKYSEGGSQINILESNGNWKYIIPVPAGKTNIDGTYRIYFRVTDKAGTVFTTGETLNPKFKYEENAVTNAAVGFSVDTTPPTITDNRIYIVSGDLNGALANNTYLGGKKRPDGRIYIYASDNVTKFDNPKFRAILKGLGSSDIEMTKSGSNMFVADGLDFTSDNGYKNIQIVVEEPSGLSVDVKRSVILDNLAPGANGSDIIKNESPVAGIQVTGEVKYTGLVQDDETVNSGVEKIEYYIPRKNASGTVNETDPATIPEDSWKGDSELNPEESIKLNSMIWTISKLNMHVKTSNTGDTLQDDYLGYETEPNAVVFDVPVWFKVTDRVGNVGYSTSSRINYNPDGDRPLVNITYPSENTELGSGTLKDNTNKYVIMGGNIMITGNANDNEGLDSVYVQYDVDGDGDFDDDDYNWINTNKNSVLPSGAVLERKNINGISFWGVKADGTQTWQTTFNVSAKDNSGNYLIKGLQIDEKNEDGTAANADNKTLNIRVRSVDNDISSERGQLVSAWTKTIHVSVNNSVPVLQKFVLNQYDSAAKTNKIKTRKYEQDVYISGTNWFLEGEVRDDDGISSISVSGSASGNMTTQPAWFKDGTEKNSSGVVIQKLISIPVTGTDSWGVEIEAFDNDTGNKKNTRARYEINIDNTKPAFTEGTVGGAGDKKDDLKIHMNSGEGPFMHEGKIQNSDGNFTVAGKITEAGSGFERVAFYVLRRGSTSRIYNVMESSGNRTDLSAVQGTGVYIDSTDNLPLKKVTGLTRGTELTFTMTAAADSNVRKGGLVKIGGSYKRIVEISADKRTITIDSACPTDVTEAYLVYATMSIDQANDSVKNGSVSETDGDGMVESYSKAGSTYSWDATFDSHNIPDGPIEFHFVAFDKAGNMNHGFVHTTVSNNPPRLTKVYLGTDLNQNGSFEANEFEEYSSIQKVSAQIVAKPTDKWNLTTNKFKVKNGLALVPEFVGGTGSIKMVVKKDALNDDAATGSGSTLVAALTGTEAAKLTPDVSVSKQWNSSNTDIVDIDSAFHKYKLSNTELWGSNPSTDGTYSKGERKYSFTFWDETEELVQGSTSQNAVLYLNDLYLDMKDTEKPNVVVNKFKWKSTEDNSLYENKAANGHIELEADLGDGSLTGYTTGLPKVSGKVVFRGTVYDDVCLSGLSFTMTGSPMSGSLATYDSANSKWNITDKTMEADGYELEIYEEEDFVKRDPVENPGESGTEEEKAAYAAYQKHLRATANFSSSDAYFNQKGHKIAWALSYNTEKVSAGQPAAALNRTFTVTATDKAANASTGRTASETAGDETMHRPDYRVDVVPYITEVKTNLSKMDPMYSTVYSRSALGYYPVAADEVVSVEGFNFGSSPKVYIGETEITGTGVSAGAITNVNIGSNTSDSVTVKVSDIETINNKNSAKAKYNFMPNRRNNNLLDDNVALKVWEFKNMAEPVAVERIMYPTVKMSPKDGRIGASFANSYYFHMAGFRNNSTTEWESHAPFLSGYDGSDANSFAFDKNGYTYGGVQYRASDLPSEGGAFNFVFSTAKPENDMSLADVYRCNTGSARLEANCTNLGIAPTLEKTEWAYNKWRVKSPQFVAVANDDSTETTVYTAYYDSTTKQIRYRKGVVNAAGLVGNNSGFGDSGDHTDIGDNFMMKGTNDSLKDVWHTDGQATTGGYWETVKAYPGFIADIDQGNAWDSKRNGEFGQRHVNAADSLQTENNQIIHVLGSNGLVSDDSSWDETIYDTEGTLLFYKWVNENANPTVYYSAPDNAHPNGENVLYLDEERTILAENINCWQNGDNTTVQDKRNWSQITYTKVEVREEPGSHIITHYNGIQGIYRKTDTANNHTYENGAGEYVALGVLSKNADAGKAVIAWYDDNAKKLLIAKEGTFTGDAALPNAGENFKNSYARTSVWERNTRDLGSGGEYVQMAVDSDDNIHIAHYDSSTGGELKYVKLDASLNVLEQFTVDSFDDVGSYLTINVGKDASGNQVPFIGYYGRKHAKVAYRVNFRAGSEKSLDKDGFFTQSWEVMYVPTKDSIDGNVENKVNVAMWTKADGTLGKSPSAIAGFTEGTTAFNGAKTTTGDTVPSGRVLANGSNNPVVAYINGAGALEYAQIKGDSAEITFKQ